MSFWKWYESKYKIIAPITALLFVLQLVHLYWMTVDVAFVRIFGYPFWDPGKFWSTIIAFVDYTEIPAIISSTIFYIHQYRGGLKWRSILFIFLINSQWIHLFWITDEIIYTQFTGTALIVIPLWLSWCAICIDYLELPVMIDTIIKSIRVLHQKNT
jgi:hypothetical protein